MSSQDGVEREPKPSKIRRLVSLGNLSLTITLAIGVLGILLTYASIQEPTPGVTLETISDTNVLDVRRPLQDLSIEFRGQDVQEQNLSLRILTINVVNSGEVDILPGHFDLEDDWGISFDRGEVVEARLVDASSDYLQTKMIPMRMGINSVAFPKAIFEEGSFFAIEVLLLHPKSDTPRIASLGKIAGIDEVTILTRPLAREEVGFLTEVLQGSPSVQFVRALVYPTGIFFFFFAMMLALALFAAVLKMLNAGRRKGRIWRTTTIRKMERVDIRDWLVGQYEKEGLEGLKRLQNVVADSSSLVFLKVTEKTDDGEFELSSMWVGGSEFTDNEFTMADLHKQLDELESMSVLKKSEDNTPVFTTWFTANLEKLCADLGA